MKIKLDIDATPEEMRQFFGLPDVASLQEEMMSTIREKMLEGAEGFDPATLLSPSLPDHLKSMEELQKAFWQGLSQSTDKGGKGGE